LFSGYCVQNVGHNHPYIIQALKDEMDRCGPAMLQSHLPPIAGDLARRLCELASGGPEKFAHQQRELGRGSGHQVCARRDWARAYRLCGKQF
jgi:4-aminobutyrate aminotransferase-like enzyme